MGNSQNTKLDRKFSSLPPSNFPSPKSESSFIRKITRATRRKHHNVEVEPGDLEKAKDWPLPFVDALFLPEYPLKTDEDQTNFQVIEVIAKGAFGDVLRVQRVGDQAGFAMKVMKKSQVIVDGAVQQCKDEATIQDSVGHHPFIVKPFYFFQSRENVYIVMEYIPRGELFAAWRHLDSFGETLVKIYIAELAMVLDYLHNSCIIYRDLKMENILIDAQGHLQVIDFGLAKWLRPGHRTGTICGTLQYIAPEVLTIQPYGHSADWWSLGILMYALLTGEYPVNGASNHLEMAEKVKGHVYELPTHNSHSWCAREAIKKLLQFDPNKRVTDLGQLQQLEFFQDINFDALLNRQISPNIYLESEETFGFGFREQELLRRRRSVARSVDGELDMDLGFSGRDPLSLPSPFYTPPFSRPLSRSASVDWDLGMDRGYTHDFYVPHDRTIDVDWTLTEPAYSEPPPQPEVYKPLSNQPMSQPLLVSRTMLRRSASVDWDLGMDRGHTHDFYVPHNRTIDVDWTLTEPAYSEPPPQPEVYKPLSNQPMSQPLLVSRTMLRRSASVDWDLGMDRGHTHDFYVPHNRTIDVDWTLTEPAYSEPPPQPEVYKPLSNQPMSQPLLVSRTMLRRSASVDWDLGMDRGHTHDFYVPHNRTIDVDWTLTEPAYSEPPPQPEGYINHARILWNESVASLNASFV